MDWNWFFSSVAQSIAAMVGLVAAFVVAKILNNQSEYTRKLNRARELIDESRGFQDAANNRSFSWFNKYSLELALDALDYDLKRDERQLTPKEYYDKIRFPSFLPREEVLKRIAARVRVGPLSPDPVLQPYGIDSESMRRSSNQQMRPALDREEELIDQLVLDLKRHVRRVQLHGSELRGNPESSVLVSRAILVLLGLFYLCVIFPLGQLPASVADSLGPFSIGRFVDDLLSLKGFVLAVPSVLVGLTAIAFWRLNAYLKYPREVLNDMERWGGVRNYSSYLRTWIENVEQEEQERARERGASAPEGVSAS